MPGRSLWTLFSLVVVLSGSVLWSPCEVAAFHSGGVAECSGCHSMHSAPAGGTFLLLATDSSSTCLTCHQGAADTGPTSYHVSTPDSKLGAGLAPLQRTPAGDFGWLKKTYMYVVRPGIFDYGQTHGHNIVAADFGYVADGSNTTSPGGSYPASHLACNSCHDGHGQYRRLSTGAVATKGAPIIASGSYATNATPGYAEPPTAGTALGVYRLLAGAGYSKAAFPGVPQAKTPSTYNRTEATSQTRTAYGHLTTNGHASWGDWCGTCHAAMHAGSNKHPIDDTLGSEIKTNYDRYVKSGDLTGTNATAFSSLVPFVENGQTYSGLATHARNDDTFLNGPATSDRVSCLSCHRAHASGWRHSLRWNMEAEFIVYNGLYPGTDTTPTAPQFARGRLGSETQAAYYDRPVTKFASYQRVLCNKCHAND